jgi:hypothetical protein
MSDFDDSNLWRISEFTRVRRDQHVPLGPNGERQTTFPSTLQAELDALGRNPVAGDTLEVVAALLRHREAALLYLAYERLVWPITVFPIQMIYHSPRDLLDSAETGLRTLRPLAIEPPGVLPPGHWKHERVADPSRYHPLAPLLWQFALKGPRRSMLAAIGGPAAYRTLHNARDDALPAPGALGPALDRLGREPLSLEELAALPGMSLERASRLLNGLYLVSNLMVTRASRAARREPRFPFLRKPRN